MTIISDILSQAQIDELSALRVTATAGDQTAAGTWAPVYQRLREFLTTTTIGNHGVHAATNVAGVDRSVWIWLQGAKLANAGVGNFADLIRQYSKIQFKLHYGTDATDAQINQASNDLANAFTERWVKLDEAIPTIQDVVDFDSGTIAKDVFRFDRAPWSGTFLFATLGNSQPYSDWVLQPLLNPLVQLTAGGPTEKGSYNAISIAQGVQDYNPAAHGLISLLENAAGLLFGEDGLVASYTASYAATVTAISAEADAKFIAAYGLDGEAQTIHIGADTFGSWDIASNIGKTARYKVGTKFNDTLDVKTTDDIFWGVGFNVVLNAGRGDDLIYGSGTLLDYLLQPLEIIDGGEGKDTLSYIKSELPVDVTFDQKGLVGARIIVEKAPSFLPDIGYKDIVTNVEKLVLSNFNDTVKGADDATLKKFDGLSVDAAAGDDSIVIKGGSNITTIGGAGRDYIYNLSAGGIIYGDTFDGTYLDAATGTLKSIADAVNADAGTKTGAWHNFSDTIQWSADTTVADAGHNDFLTFYGTPLTGGDTSGGITLQASGGAVAGLAGIAIGAAQGAYNWVSGVASIYVDYIIPGIEYQMDIKGGHPRDLLVYNVYKQLDLNVLGVDIPNPNRGVMRIKNFDLIGGYIGQTQADYASQGTFGMVFKKANPLWEILAKLPDTAISVALTGGGAAFGPLIDMALTWTAYTIRNAKANSWATGGDPLVLDLAGRGLNSTSLDGSEVHFDLNNDFFAERTGWIGSGAGLLALDRNGNGKIDDVTELFGSYTGSGLGDLATYDINHDGKIDAGDQIFSTLKVWQDVNGDGITQTGELQSLSQLGIASISLNGQVVNGTTPQGTEIRTYSTFTRTDGSTSGVYDAVFGNDQTDTVYRGERGQASWVGATAIDVKGFGRVTNLAVAAANDFELAEVLKARAAAMTVADLHTLAVQAGDVLGAWGATQPLTRELTPVLTSADGKTLLDRAIYVEDATGGYYTLKSGAAVHAADGAVIARPSMAQILAQGSANGATWHLEQAWSPDTRGTAVTFRDAAPYLMHVVAGRAVIDDYGIKQADGAGGYFWALASGTAIKDANGNVIAAPTKADILAQAHSAGSEWRAESLGYNPYATIPVSQIGIDIVNGNVADYTVRVTDQDGSFYVWARNLDRALSLQAKQGTSLAFNLRNYEVDFGKLQQQVDSSDDSKYRIELLTPAQFNFAVKLSSIQFQPEMLTADNSNRILKEAA